MHVGRFKTPSHIIDDRMFSGTLFETVEQTVNYLIGHLKVAFEITGKNTQRSEIFEYPLPALRELVLNAIVHRDYLSPTDIQIKIFDKSISFFNPGKLYGDLKIEDLKRNDYQASTRNKLIAEAFYLTGEIEKYGSGIIRIREAIKEYPTMTLKVKEAPNGFLTELGYEKQKESNDVTKNVTENVTENRASKILRMIKVKPEITTAELAKGMKVAKRTVLRDIEKLKEEGKIRYEGPARNGHWTIL